MALLFLFVINYCLVAQIFRYELWGTRWSGVDAAEVLPVSILSFTHMHKWLTQHSALTGPENQLAAPVRLDVLFRHGQTIHARLLSTEEVLLPCL